MADTHSLEDFKRHIKVYIAVFVALLVGTIITVLAWWWANFPALWMTIALALFIAVIKAFLVAGYFMHLMSERKTIYAILLTTAFFFAGLMYLIVWSREEMPRGTRWHTGPNTSSQIQNAQ